MKRPSTTLTLNILDVNKFYEKDLSFFNCADNVLVSEPLVELVDDRLKKKSSQKCCDSCRPPMEADELILP